MLRMLHLRSTTCRSLPFLSSMCSFRQGYSPTGVVGCCRNYGARAFRLVLPSTPRCDNRGTYSPAAIGISDSHLRRTLISSLLCYGMQTPQGKTLLAMVDEGLPQDAIGQSASVQLDTLLPVRSLTSLSYNQDVQPSKGMLQRRIEEVKSKEKDEIVQEITYALVASKLLSAISRTPEEDASHSHSSLCSSIHPLSIQDVLIMQQRQQFSGLDDVLQAIHSSDVQKLTARHVVMVIHGKAYTEADRVPSEHRKVLHVDKFDFGKLYAASVMYGYFLSHVQQRFQLEKRFLMENSGVYQKDYEAFSLESYMALQGAETLHRWSCIRSSHALQIIDQHCTILFGKYPSGPHIEQVPFGDAEMIIHLSYVKILTYQALAFGALLWDVQHNFTPLYPHVCGGY